MSFPAYRGLDKLQPLMRERAEFFLKAVGSAGLFIIITETWRSRERQEYLYSLGRTQPGKIVTWTLQSNHMQGEAFDIAFMKGDKLTYEGDWEGAGRIGEKNGLVWGGRWPTPDRPHFEFNRQWQQEHWASEAERKLLASGAFTTRKNLDEPPTRGELYVILKNLHHL